jgi:hypothetical protein
MSVSLSASDYSLNSLAEQQNPHDNLSKLTVIKQQNFDFRWRENEAARTHVKTVASAVCNIGLLAERENQTFSVPLSDIASY